MKKRGILFILLLAIGFGLMISVGTYAQSKADKAKACYLTYLENHCSRSEFGNYYDIVDINGDKVPELLLSKWNENRSYLFTYNAAAGKMKKLKSREFGRLYTGVFYAKKKHLVSFGMADTAGSSYIVYKYTGKKLKKLYKVEYYNWKGSKKGYWYNGKKISDTRGEKIYKKLKKTFRELRYTWN